MTFDRSKFKTSSVEQRKRQQEEHDKKTKYQGDDSGYVKPLKLENGKNYLRVFPIHPTTMNNVGELDAMNMYPYTVHFLDTQVTYKKDGEDITEIKRLPHLCSKVHGGTEKSLLSEYIDFAHKKVFDEVQGDEEQKKALATMKHYQKGVMAGTSWACYVKMYTDRSKSKFVRGLIYLPTSVVNAMDKLAMDEDEVEDVMTSGDIFADINTGYMMVVKRDPEAGKKDPKDYYVTSIDIRGGEDPLTDDDLEWLMNQKPLDEMFLNIYSKRDFEQSLKCISAFDKTQPELNLFSYDEFLDTVEEISNYYTDETGLPQSENEASKEGAEKKVAEKPKSMKEKLVERSKENEVPKEESDMPWDTPLEKLDRAGLEGYIKRNKLPIKIRDRYTDEDLIDYIKEEEAIIKAEQAAEEKDALENSEESPESNVSSRMSELTDGLDLED